MISDATRFPSLKCIQDKENNFPVVSYLLRVKNEGKMIRECIDSILAQNFEDNFEIVVLDSGSTDDTLSILLEYDIRIYAIDSIEFSFGSSCNLIADLARGKFLVFMSGHVLLIDVSMIKDSVFILNNHSASAGFFKQIPNDEFGASLYERIFLDYTYRKSHSFKGYQTNSNIGFSNAASIICKESLINNRFPDLIASEDFFWSKVHLELGRCLFYFDFGKVAHSHNETPEQVYKRVSINVGARYGPNPKLLMFTKYFTGITFLMLLRGASFKDSISYAFAHARAYYSVY